MKLTGNPRGVQLLILGLLLATLWFSCRPVKAAAEEMFFASVGATMRGSDVFAGGLRIGMESGPWQASIVTAGGGHVDKPDARHAIEPNVGACGTWHRGRKKLSFGWGACLWEHGDFVVGQSHRTESVQLAAAIVLRRTFGEKDHVYVELFHVSTGGSTHFNAGRNLISVGARF